MNPKDSENFVRIFGILSGSSFIVQLIALLIYPIISRIYTPDYFGERAIFVSVLTLLVAIASFGYEIAINIPKKEQDAAQITGAGIYLVGFSSILFTFILFAIGPDVLSRIGIGSIWNYRYLIPIGIFLGGSFQLLQHWLLRKENYSIISKTRIVRSFSKSGIELMGGFINPNSWWLITAWLIGNFSSSIRYFFIFIREKSLISCLNFRSIIKSLAIYIQFPKYQLASNFLRTFYVQIPVFLFSYAFSVSEAGQYAIAYAVFSVACVVIIDSYSSYHLVQMGQLLNRQLKAWQKYYRKMLFRCLKLSLPLAFLMVLIGEWSVIFVFGKDWGLAGEMLRYLSILFISFFLYTFSFHIFTQLQKQRSHLLFNVIRLFLLTFWLLIWRGTDIRMEVFLLTYGITDLVISLIQTYQAYKFLDLEASKNTPKDESQIIA